MKPYYQDDYATIYHGDCREILPLLAPVDLILTDPPYGVGFEYHSHDDTPIGYADFIKPIFEEMRRKAKVVMLTTGMRNLWLYPQADWVMCWAKPGATRRSDLGGFNVWEPVLVYGRPKIYNDFKMLPSVVNISEDVGKLHPCPKPIKLYTWLIGEVKPQTLIDPFMGSGTSLRAAKELGVCAIGIELEERYCELAARRLRQEVMNFA